MKEGSLDKMFWVRSVQVKEGWESTPGRWGSNNRNKGSGMGPWLPCWGLSMQFHFSGTEWPQNKEKAFTFWNLPGDGSLTLHQGVWIYQEHSLRSYCRFLQKWEPLKVVSEKMIKQGDRMKPGKVKPMPARASRGAQGCPEMTSYFRENVQVV